MALKLIGSWRQCQDYKRDDVVLEGGEMYKATSQNAGMRPSEHPEYWAELTPDEKREVGGTTPIFKHNDLEGIDATQEGATFHVSEEEAAAIVGADSPSADNAFVTASVLKAVEDTIPHKHSDLEDIDGLADDATYHITEEQAMALAGATDDPYAKKSDFDNFAHDELNQIKILGNGEKPWHVGDVIAGAIMGATDPSEDNPFVTVADLPALGKGLGRWQEVEKPDAIGTIYDACYDEFNKVLCVVSDNAIGFYDTTASANAWTTQLLTGAWRCVTILSDGTWVIAGNNCAAVGATGAVAVTPIKDGRYNAAATNGAKAVLVGDGVVSWYDGAFTGIDTPAGYGEGVAYHTVEAKWYTVGRSGCRSSADLNVWTDDTQFPAGTWRDIVYVADCLIAVSGKLAYRRDNRGVWAIDKTEIGGWDGVAGGSGYVVAVTNGRCAVSKKVPPKMSLVEIPDYIYSCVAYGGGAFWACGSTIMVARLRDIDAALAAAEDPSGDNPIATKSAVESIVRDMRDEIDERLIQVVRAGRLLWEGNSI